MASFLEGIRLLFGAENEINYVKVEWRRRGRGTHTVALVSEDGRMEHLPLHKGSALQNCVSHMNTHHFIDGQKARCVPRMYKVIAPVVGVACRIKGKLVAYMCMSPESPYCKSNSKKKSALQGLNCWGHAIPRLLQLTCNR